MNMVRRFTAVFTVAAIAIVLLTGSAGAVTFARLPKGMTAGYLLVDEVTGQTISANEHKRFRSASLVKLFIALDYLESRGPGYKIPAGDLALLRPMLRSSNNDAASTLWVRDGWEEIVNRMITLIGLTDTAPPVQVDKWGYTAVSAADVVKTYQYILHIANRKYREFIMGNLHQTTKCGSDRFDQSFGIPSALPRPWGVKQGWSGFGATPAPGAGCTGDGQSEVPASPEVKAATALASSGDDMDLTSKAMHTSGTIGLADRRIMAVLTLEPATITWGDSSQRITGLTQDVYRHAIS
jgi:hypothetical protein